MLYRFILLCLFSLQQQVHAGIMQPPEYERLPDSEIREMLDKYPELRDKFHSLDVEYSRYMDEVRSVLLSDSGMRDKLDSLDDKDLAFGEIAEELNNLNPKLRSKLSEIKRAEVDRLLDKHRKYVKVTGKDLEDITHFNTNNLETFEAKDLRYLLKAITHDMSKIDEMRRQLFKEHEMAKKFEEEEKLKSMNKEEKSKYLAEKETMAEIHREREKTVLHPGSEQQFKDVWENTDQMKDQTFNPTTFFLLHDLNGDQVWDENEVKALFYREIKRLFKEDDPDFDPAEKEEESELMREHYFAEADKNHDRLVSMQEYLKHVQNSEYLKKEWTPYNNKPMFTKEEYETFSRKQKLRKELEKIKAES